MLLLNPYIVGTTVHGDILLNGRRIGPFMHRISGFVHQDDLFLGTLTVVEHLTFMVSSVYIYIIIYHHLSNLYPRVGSSSSRPSNKSSRENEIDH